MRSVKLMKARAVLLLEVWRKVVDEPKPVGRRAMGIPSTRKLDPALAMGAGAGGACSPTAPAQLAEAGAPAALVLPPICTTTDTQVPPNNLVCTGLYTDIAAKQIAPGIEAYAPAVPLWSDGAQKQRWISLPPGQVIDNSDPNEWTFPVGTRVWKEFSKAGQRVRPIRRKTDINWWTPYAQDSDESAAVHSGGGDIPFGTGTYHIPTSDSAWIATAWPH